MLRRHIPYVLTERFDRLLNLTLEVNDAVLDLGTLKFHWLPEVPSDREKKRNQNVRVNQVERYIKQNSGI